MPRPASGYPLSGRKIVSWSWRYVSLIVRATCAVACCRNLVEHMRCATGRMSPLPRWNNNE
eukprot:scaffold77482_cov27-Tisochrysis_lutea.AAC.4